MTARSARLLGYHLLWFWAVRLVGTPEQIAAVEEQATKEQWFFGGAVNPRDADLLITDEGEEIVFRGEKSFSTGGRISDVTVLEGVLEGAGHEGKHVFAIVPTDQEAIRFKGDWDTLGQRLTESGGVVIDGVRVPWEAAAGYVRTDAGWEFQPRVYNTLNVPLIQSHLRQHLPRHRRGCAGDRRDVHPGEDPALALHAGPQGVGDPGVLHPGDLRRPALQGSGPPRRWPNGPPP
ncbi:hypothetical protein [Nocardioides convexus]|uniref:hypothetical protein n=1 Tax=Nocardioides convexus TaxID=2712224 RepID=UPI00241876C3|nr:hypothetical protein [Nocardioides convexus]